MQITVVACANAGGTVIPPMAIFEWKRLNSEWTWMKDLFLPNIPPARLVLLLLDGHSSHYEPDTIRYAASQNGMVLYLPPHTTHISQPLDVSFFKPLKSYWSEVWQSIHARQPRSCCDKVSVFTPVFYSMVKSYSTRDNCQWVQESWCVSY